MAKHGNLNLLGISGSLRKESFNTALLKAAQELAPDGITITLRTLHDIPLYNEDIRQQGFPDSVVTLRREIAEADGLLIATPEYNFSIPGVLKNAIDWASRPPDRPLDGKPVAIMGASPGRLGTVRSQMHLRQCLSLLNMLVLNRPEVLVAHAPSLFDEDLRLTDEQSREFVAQLLQGFADWIAVTRPKVRA
jgi:chromate reductase